jgi:hypothetical protein
VFSWRKRYGDNPSPPARSSAPQMIPVVITAERGDVAAQPSMVAGKIEIDAGGTYRVSVDGRFDGTSATACARRVGGAMIPVPSSVRVWLAGANRCEALCAARKYAESSRLGGISSLFFNV